MSHGSEAAEAPLYVSLESFSPLLSPSFFERVSSPDYQFLLGFGVFGTFDMLDKMARLSIVTFRGLDLYCFGLGMKFHTIMKCHYGG